jgi:hypothetical protein
MTTTKEEEYSENDIGIFGHDSSSSDNDSTKHDDDDDIDSSDHDDQEEEEAQSADDQQDDDLIEASSVMIDMLEPADDQQDDDLIEASSVMSDMLEPEWRQQMRQEDQQAYNKTMKQTRGLFDFSLEKFITLPEYKKETKFEFDISPAKLCDYLYNNAASDT